MSLRALGLVALVALLPGESSEGIEKGRKLLADLTARSARVASFEARFEQVYRSALAGGEVREKGTLTVKRPGRARWEYTEPEAKLALVTAEGDTWFYLPAEKQVLHGRLAGREEPHLAFLLGKGDLARDFEVLEARIGDSLALLRLRPKAPIPGVEKVLLTLVLHPLSVQSVSLEDTLGGETQYIFTGLRENVEAPETLFVFHPPPGVEVVEEGGEPAGVR